MINAFISQLISSIIQVLLASLIPFIVWKRQRHSSQLSFFKWIGIQKEGLYQKKVWRHILFVTLIFSAISYGILQFVGVSNLANSQFKGLGLSAIPLVLVYAFIQTSLSEEILFRGFILKSLIKPFGFLKANIIQAILFGTLHGVLMFTVLGFLKTLVVVLFTGFIGYLMGFINEKKANGSIVPSWLIHGLANLFSSCLLIFNLIV